MTELTHFYNLFQPEHYDVFIDINRASKQIKGTVQVLSLIHI